MISLKRQFDASRKRGKRLSGFTIVELLVVVAIIGILATLVTINVRKAQITARDTKRMSDLNTIAKAIQQYQESRDTYIIAGANQNGEGWFNTKRTGEISANSKLIEAGYLSGTVADPVWGEITCTSCTYHGYMYYFQSNPDAACIFSTLEASPTTEQTAARDNCNNVPSAMLNADQWADIIDSGHYMKYAIKLIP